MSGGAVIIGLFLTVYVALAVVAWRRKLLARLAFREALRRPLQSGLVVVGLMVGTSMILMSAINADSMSLSLTQATYTSWGRVDILVAANGQFFSPDVANRLASSPLLDRKVRGVQAGVELLGSAADLDQTLDNPTVRLIGFDPATQAAFGSFNLIDGRITEGRDLHADEVLLTQSLAESIHARTGDLVRVGAGGIGPVDYKVFGVARPTGPGAYGAQPAIFATLSAMAMLTRNSQINVVRLAANGDGQDEMENSLRIAPSVSSALRDIAPDTNLRVQTAKADDVKEIVNLAAENEPVNFALSSLVILAGIALVVNLALALAEERRPHLAVLRALGLTRSGLVITALIEGGIYSLAGAAIGAVPGIAAGWVLVSNAGKWIPEIHEKSATIVFVVTAQALAVSIAAGALVTVATLFLASVRTTRLAIASAVRSLPDPPAPGGSRGVGAWATAAVAALGAVAAAFGSSPLRFVGGIVVIAALGQLLRHHISGRVCATLVGLAAVLWVVGFYSTLSLDEIETDVWLMVATVAVSVAALSMVVAANMRFVERFISRSLVGQLTRREPKLALAASALGLVLSLVTFIGVFIASTNPDYRSDTNGYDVAVTSTSTSSLNLPPGLASMVGGELAVSDAAYLGPVRSTSSDRGPGPLDWHQQMVMLYGLTDDQLASSGLTLASREARYPSDDAVWAALRNDPGLVVSGTYVPGTIVYMVGNNGPTQVEVIGSFRSGFFAGLLGSSRTMTSLVSSPGGEMMLLRLKPGVDPHSFALNVRRALFPDGVEAVTTRELLDQGGVSLRNFASEVEALMIAALAVGVLSLGVQALRAVVERRRSVGLLRALGLQPPPLVVGIIIESLLAAAAGVVVGVVSGSAIGYFFMSRYYTGGAVSLHVNTLSLAVILTFLTAAAVTLGPALAAARTAPAQALRLID